MNKDTLGLYLHVPFCVKKCNYCDFCSFAADEKTKSNYVDALLRQIASAPADAREVDSVFFGGGTPSLLAEADFARIFSALREKYRIAHDAEITVEVNPGTVTESKADALRSLGVNRISMGLQSAIDGELRILGRIHTYAQFLESYRLLRSRGFDNVNIDLMYAIPGQSKDSLEQTLAHVIALSPEHISAYSLIIEENTPFGRKRESLSLPGEEEESEMYILVCKMLSDAGYLHYEISNYARQGKLCRHNLRYWQGGDYLGFGLAAHSLYRAERLAMTESLDAYLSEPTAFESRIKRDAASEAEEYVMLGLRTSFGISLSEYRTRFGEDLLLGKEEKIDLYQGLGYLSRASDRLALTEKGFYLSNAIICELI